MGITNNSLFTTDAPELAWILSTLYKIVSDMPKLRPDRAIYVYGLVFLLDSVLAIKRLLASSSIIYG
jgi:hypothetical protein